VIFSVALVQRWSLNERFARTVFVYGRKQETLDVSGGAHYDNREWLSGLGQGIGRGTADLCDLLASATMSDDFQVGCHCPVRQTGVIPAALR
jgi:hypothetical protein